MSRIQEKVFIFTLGLLCLASACSIRAAEFSLDLRADTPGSGFPGPCNMGFNNSSFCPTAGTAQEIDPDTTPYTQEQVTIDGVNYWHQVIGDPEQGFAMEVYTRTAGFLMSESGGRNSNFPGIALYRQELDVQSGNGWDPLGLNPAIDYKTTGNGTADPTRVIMRQILGGTWNSANNTWSCGTAEFCLDFSKGAFDAKPRITQTINDVSGGFSAYFDLDMSNSTYSDNTTAGIIVNTVSLDGNAPGNFDMAVDKQNSTVTGGQYTYAPGAGWVDTGTASGYQTWDYDEGSYSYIDGGADQLNQNWASFYDPAQNFSPGPGNESKCDSGAIAGSCL